MEGVWKIEFEVRLFHFFCSRLTKSAKKEAEDWARQTKRTLVMEMIKQRKHTWISRPKRQVLMVFLRTLDVH